jgi:hypothetical protein
MSRRRMNVHSFQAVAEHFRQDSARPPTNRALSRPARAYLPYFEDPLHHGGPTRQESPRRGWRQKRRRRRRRQRIHRLGHLGAARRCVRTLPFRSLRSPGERAPVLTPSASFFSAHTSHHPGNVLHNDLVFGGVLEWLLNDDYFDAENDEAAAAAAAEAWAAIQDRIVSAIWRTGGRHRRFIASTGIWTNLGDDECRGKVDRAMRSRLSWFRNFDRPDRTIQVVNVIHDNDYKRGRGGS